ncbi:MAG: hypothetical protein ACPG21_07915 [Crocinitomicaceae bacterium]
MEVETQLLPVSINDLRDKYFDDLPLTEEEERALDNFDRYRLQQLNAAKNDEEFKVIYLKIQTMANLSSYRYFLDVDLIS